TRPDQRGAGQPRARRPLRERGAAGGGEWRDGIRSPRRLGQGGGRGRLASARAALPDLSPEARRSRGPAPEAGGDGPALGEVLSAGGACPGPSPGGGARIPCRGAGGGGGPPAGGPPRGWWAVGGRPTAARR